MFLILTNLEDEKIRFHVHNIAWYIKGKENKWIPTSYGEVKYDKPFTSIFMINKEFVNVKETPEQIDEKMNICYITVSGNK